MCGAGCCCREWSHGSRGSRPRAPKSFQRGSKHAGSARPAKQQLRRSIVWQQLQTSPWPPDPAPKLGAVQTSTSHCRTSGSSTGSSSSSNSSFRGGAGGFYGCCGSIEAGTLRPNGRAPAAAARTTTDGHATATRWAAGNRSPRAAADIGSACGLQAAGPRPLPLPLFSAARVAARGRHAAAERSLRSRSPEAGCWRLRRGLRGLSANRGSPHRRRVRPRGEHASCGGHGPSTAEAVPALPRDLSRAPAEMLNLPTRPIAGGR